MKSVDSSLPVQTENKLGTEKISRLMLTTGVPLMLSLLINSLYNFVDSIFVSRVAEDALTALSLAAPVQMFVSAIGLGNAIGLNATISAASITNIILDPILIFALNLGTKGAAIATVIGQFVGMVAGILINRRWNKEIPFKFTLHPDVESIKTIVKVGFPSTLVQVLTGFVNVAMNSILLAFSSTAVAVFGVCCRMQGICTVAVHGINNGMIPIVAYNYGARLKNRISESIKYAIVDSVIFYIPLLLILELFPDKVMLMFKASENMISLGLSFCSKSIGS